MWNQRLQYWLNPNELTPNDRCARGINIDIRLSSAAVKFIRSLCRAIYTPMMDDKRYQALIVNDELILGSERCCFSQTDNARNLTGYYHLYTLYIVHSKNLFLHFWEIVHLALLVSPGSWANSTQCPLFEVLKKSLVFRYASFRRS